MRLSPSPHTAAREKPDRTRRFLVAQEQNSTPPAQNRRYADPRLHHAFSPTTTRIPACLSRWQLSSSTSTRRTDATGMTTSCAMRMPGSTENGSRAVFEQHDADLSAVAGVDQPGRVDDADPVPRGEALTAAGRTPRIPPESRRRGPVGTTARSPGPRTTAIACREVEASVALVGLLGDARIGSQPANSEIDHVADASSSRASSTRYRANRAASARGSRARTRTPSGVSRRSAIGAPSS